jgi:hypothetical protein
MKLSVVMMSCNVGLRTCLNILNACALGTDDVEVLICDTTGNAEKRRFLSEIHERNCRTISTDDGPGNTILNLLLDRTGGEFVFLATDEGYINCHSIPWICKEIDRVANDLTTVGITGIFAVEGADETSLLPFDGLSAPIALDRLKNVLGVGVDVCQYSPFRFVLLCQSNSLILDGW